MNKTEWILCPICGNKTRTMIREDTELRNFPLYCPKCKKETIINAQDIYEDDISGAISHERFLKLSAEYEAEQKELTKQVKTDREMVNAYEQDKADFDSFAAVIRKYVGITELTPTIVNEFVKKIIVHAPDKSSGHRR